MSVSVNFLALDNYLPDRLTSDQAGSALWSPLSAGCATSEEAYSGAMSAYEACRNDKRVAHLELQPAANEKVWAFTRSQQ